MSRAFMSKTFPAFFQIVLLLLSFLITLPAEALKNAPAAAGVSKEKSRRKEFMWKVSSESGAVLYLLGTVHVFKSADYPLPEEMEKAFSKARGLLVEYDSTRSDSDSARSIVKAKALYAPPDEIANHIDRETDNRLRRYCLSSNLPYDAMKRLKPWMVCLQIVAQQMAKLGYSPEEGIDLHFMKEANASKKRIIGLETQEFQLNLFADFSPKLQADWLKLGLIDLDNLPADAGKIMKAWKDGDEKSMEEVLSRDEREHPECNEVIEKLLYQRNLSMADKLEPYLKGEGSYMAAVGSMHLVGDRGLIELFRKRGYKVRQITAGEAI